jgi:4-amino-4-deoxy-L-arabinose transferase-like glycosyltransferase
MDSLNTTAQTHPPDWKVSRTAALVIMLGLAARFYLLFYIPLISKDGFLYIQQAKALHYGLLNALTSCAVYLSPYPILVALSFNIFGDWVIGAQMVSLFFGAMTLLPIYWLSRRFFDETISSLAVLCFALIPPFVLVSRDALRDPVYWFFSMMGLYLFVLYIEKRRNLFPLLSSICFAVAAWTRVEATLFILISVLYLLLTVHEHKWKHLLFFLLPFVLLALLATIYQAFSSIDILALLNPKRLTRRVLEVFSSYEKLRQNLKAIEDQRLFEFSSYFFPRVRNLVWLIALGVLAVQVVETLFYIFFIILSIGIATSWRRVSKDSRLIYLSVLSISALIALYAQIIYNWSMTSRFTVLFLFPAFVFMGGGIEAIAAFLGKRFNFNRSVGYAVVCLVVLLVALPKTLRATYVKDKLLFGEVGRFIAKRENNHRAVSVASAFQGVQSIHFYANLNYPGAPCFDVDAILWQPDAAALQFVRERGYHYFIWDEKGWNGRGLGEFIEDPGRAFSKIREWRSSTRGRMILYAVRSREPDRRARPVKPAALTP